MDRRIELHEKLCDILGSRYVYFQPPESVKLHYPCIIYSLSNMNLVRADNKLYLHKNRYMVMVVDEDPDSTIHEDILEGFQYCSFDRAYTADNLNHRVLTLYY